MRRMFESMLQMLRIGNLDEEQVEGVIRDFLDIQDTEYINSHRGLVAQTFEALLEQIQNIYHDVTKIPESVRDDLFRIYVSIEHIPKKSEGQEEKDGAIILLRFLSFLKQHNSVDGDGDFTDIGAIKDILSVISEELEKIRFIFDYEIDGNLMFPIDKLLVGVIKNSNFLSQSKRFEKTEYYALKLAVRFFKHGSEGNRLLEEIKSGANLWFLDYLNTDCELIDTFDLLNYQKNGIMVFWDSKEKKVLIRSNSDDYFAGCDKKKYTVRYETTMDQKVQIGSFVEYHCNRTDNAVSVSDLMKEPGRRKDVCRLFFSGGRNIFLPRAIGESADGSLFPMNPFTHRDEYIIKEEKAFRSTSVKAVFDEFSNLALMKSQDKILNRVSVGTFAMLTDLDESPWENLLEPYEEDDFYQNQMMSRWMEQTDPDKTAAMLCDYSKELNYCESQEKIQGYTICKQHVYPLENDIYALVKRLDPRFEEALYADVISGTVTGEEEERIVILNGTGEIKTSKQICDPDNILDILEYVETYFVCCDGVLFVLDQSLLKALYGLKKHLSNCLDFETASNISSARYERLKDAISLHKQALIDGARGGFPSGNEFFDDQVYYRIIHNMAAYGIKADMVTAYLDIFEGHMLMSFDRIREDPYFRMEEKGTLYVPKDTYSSDAVLSAIYDNYIKSKNSRDKVNLYEEYLEKRNGVYYQKGHKIEKIVILLDNFENGSATIYHLSAYLNNSLESIWEDVFPASAFQDDDKPAKKKYNHLRYENAKARIKRYAYFGGDIPIPVGLDEIIRENNCSIEVHAYYGTDEGREAIDHYLKVVGVQCRPTTYKYPVQTKVGDIVEQVKQIWPETIKDISVYTVIREFSQPKINVFPKEMISNAEKAITLFIMKREKQNKYTKAMNDENLIKVMTPVVDYLLSDGALMEEHNLEDKFKFIREENNISRFYILENQIRKNTLNSSNEEVKKAVVELGVTALVKYFKENDVGENQRSNSALYLVSTLPPEIRIQMWEQIVRSDHSYVVLDKLVKAYAKNNQMDQAKTRIKDWVSEDFINEKEAAFLIEQGEVLHTYRKQLPITENMKRTKESYQAALKRIDREKDVDTEILAMMDMLTSL